MDPEGGPGEDLEEALRFPEERSGQYVRLRVLGRGSQSVVYLARDELLGRLVALKELASPDLASQLGSPPVAVARFIREAQLVAQLGHPGIVSIIELMRRPDGRLVSAQKLIAGETLAAKVQTAQSLEDRLRLIPNILSACQAVAFAHARKVIHRDLKPSNIMLGGFGETIVVDWGLAKFREDPDREASGSKVQTGRDVTLIGEALGTPSYMSPEQARGDLAAIDARSDVYSLGAILYEVLTGRPPYMGATSEEILQDVRAGELRPVRAVVPDAPRELAAIAERALRARPSDRYSDAEDLARELADYLAGSRVRAYEYGTWELLRRFASTHRALLSGMAIAAAALLVAAGIVATRLHQTRIDLASSFLERAYRAEQEGDWSKAAADFAAARAQHDTSEARWGLATAGDRITERVLSREGPAQSFVDVGVLPDGRVISLGQSPDQVEIREAESGKTLWMSSGEPVLEAVILQEGFVRVAHPDGWAFHEASSGREVKRWPRSRGFPCPGARSQTAALLNGRLLALSEGSEPRVLATDAHGGQSCAVSSDGLTVLYLTNRTVLRVVSLDDGRELAQRGPEAFRGLLSSRHGLVIVRQGRLDVLGGPDGEFSVELPEARFGVWSERPLGGSAVSADGELVAIASREGATQATVVDLRTRSIRGIVHYVPGWPRLAFSLDGQRIFAAGMGNGSVLSGWKLPGEDAPKTPRWWTVGVLSTRGRAALLVNAATARYELFRPPGTLVATGVHDLGGIKLPKLVGDRLAGFMTARGDGVGLFDLEKQQVLWEHACPLCQDLSISGDGSRFLQVGANGLEVWNTGTARLLFQEAQRVRPSGTLGSISPDGRRVAWSLLDRIFVRDLDSDQEHSFSTNAVPSTCFFSLDSTRLVVITMRSITLREAKSGRILWSASKELPDFVERWSWSPDGRALLLNHGLSAVEVLDTHSGERLAWFQALPRVVTPVLAELYAPDLRQKAVAAASTWDMRPLPQPEETPASQSLARILRRTGLQFDGVELVAAP